MISKKLDGFLTEEGFTTGSLHTRGRNFLTSESIRGQWNEAWRKYLLSQGYSGSLQKMTKEWEAAPAEPGEDTTAPEIIEAIMGTISGGEGTLTLIVSETGTAYITATDTATEPSSTQVLAGQDSTGATASDTTNFSVASGVNEVEAELTDLSDPDTYYLWVVVQDAAGNTSTVTSLGTYTIEASAYATLVADQGAYFTRTGAIAPANTSKFIWSAEFSKTADAQDWHQTVLWNAAVDTGFSYTVATNSFRPGVTGGFAGRKTIIPTTPTMTRIILAVDLAAVDFATGVQFYVDGILTTLDSQTWDSTRFPDYDSSFGVFSLLGPDYPFNGNLNYLYYALPDILPDFSIAANRDKFDADQVGSDGSGVTGAQPLVFLKGDRTTIANHGTLSMTKVGDFNAA